jgi:hypothetical protein
MGALPGAKFTIMRTLGMILNLLTIIFSFIILGIAFPSAGFFTGGIIIGIVCFVACLKLEYDFIDKYRKILLIIALVLGLTLPLIGLADMALYTSVILWIAISMYLLTICWHYTLTIYKNEKLRFILGFIGFVVLWVIFGYEPMKMLILIPIIILSISVVMTLVAERLLISKKLMNYV